MKNVRAQNMALVERRVTEARMTKNLGDTISIHQPKSLKEAILAKQNFVLVIDGRRRFVADVRWFLRERQRLKNESRSIVASAVSAWRATNTLRLIGDAEANGFAWQLVDEQDLLAIRFWQPV